MIISFKEDKDSLAESIKGVYPRLVADIGILNKISPSYRTKTLASPTGGLLMELIRNRRPNNGWVGLVISTSSFGILSKDGL